MEETKTNEQQTTLLELLSEADPKSLENAEMWLTGFLTGRATAPCPAT